MGLSERPGGIATAMRLRWCVVLQNGFQLFLDTKFAAHAYAARNPGCIVQGPGTFEPRPECYEAVPDTYT